MKIPVLFKEYIWLIETINRFGKITLAELSERWKQTEDSGGMELSRSTFNRHRDAILDMFGVIIECDRRDGNRYYIENREVLDDDSVQNWMFSTLSVGKMLDENVSLQHRILLESIPSGNRQLQQVIQAMRENRRIMLTYQRYGAAAANSFPVEPYCVKLFRRRWYVLAKMSRPHYYHDGEEQRGGFFSVFSLDRIEHMELLKTKFAVDPAFDAAAYFNECFGIVVGDGTKPERVVLRAYGLEAFNVRSLPLHHSQRELEATEEYTDFELVVRPTSDFKAHLMSRGRWLQVLSPQWLADELQQWLQAALDAYKNRQKTQEK